MLFSATQATTQALQPLQLLRSMAIPQALAGYLNSGYRESALGGVSSCSWANPGFFLYSSSVPVLRILRPSILKWYCVQPSEYSCPVFLTDSVPAVARQSALDVRTAYALKPLF